jgi:DNA-binding response OmpR family regulator
VNKCCAPDRQTVSDPAAAAASFGVRNVNCAHALSEPMIAATAMPTNATARVLVVEDDRALAELLAAALGAEGHDAAVAQRGTAALRLLEQRQPPPDVVLLDLGLPDMTADEFARRYRALPGPHAPLVVCTGADTVVAAEATQRLSAAGFLAKPFDLDTLLDLVDRHARAAP